MQNIFHRWSNSLGELEDTPEKVWGTKAYDQARHINEPTVFCGLYGLPDFFALWRHKGKRWIWWTGSDIRHFRNGYWLEDGGGIRLSPEPLAQWINRYCESWVENEVEQKALIKLGITSSVCPSFMGDVNNFPVSYRYAGTPKLYTSVSGDDFDVYGWDKIERLAQENPYVQFYLYGNRTEWKSDLSNIIVRGRVPKGQFNQETESMQGPLRLTEFDGFSEILARGILRGQWPVSLIPYPYMLSPQQIPDLKVAKEPNLAGREYYLSVLNKYPWSK